MPRKLQFFGDRRSYALRPSILQNALGLPDHIQQTAVLVAARKKAEATEYFTAAGLWIPVREIRVLDGQDADAMTEAGLLVEGTVYAYSAHNFYSRRIVRVTGTESAKRVGEFVYDRTTGHIPVVVFA